MTSQMWYIQEKWFFPLVLDEFNGSTVDKVCHIAFGFNRLFVFKKALSAIVVIVPVIISMPQKYPEVVIESMLVWAVFWFVAQVPFAVSCSAVAAIFEYARDGCFGRG